MDAYIAQNRSNTVAAETISTSLPVVSAVSWGAIFAGAAAAASLSLILLVLGTGLGMTIVSPWSNAGVSGTAFGVTTILWVTFTSLVASAVGGYLAGRLRTKWIATQTDEIYFRDTAHGFLAWALATLVTATLSATLVGSIITSGVQTGTAAVAAAGVAAAGTAGAEAAKPDAEANKSLPYFLDSLFRKDSTATTDNTAGTAGDVPQSSAASKAEISRIFINATTTGLPALPADDLKYVAQQIAQRTGLSQEDAERRVNDTYVRLQTKIRDTETAARAAADKTRKATAYGSLWFFVALLVGAFFASLAATYGGRQRDL